MHLRTFLVLISCLVATSCGRTDADPSPDQADPADGPGSGEFSVTSDQPTAGSLVGASFSLSVSFTTQTSCTKTTVGDCTVNPCYGTSLSGTESAPLPTAGTVTFHGTGAPSLDVLPQSDGNYASESLLENLPWSAGGTALTFAWEHFPGSAALPGDSLTLSSPPYIALTSESAFATAPTVLSRQKDLTLVWTSDTAPGELDEVSFDVNSAKVQVYCLFDVQAGQGVVPSAALAYLGAGDGTYSIISKEHVYETLNQGDGAWGMNFNVNAIARTPDGLAKGSLTIE